MSFRDKEIKVLKKSAFIYAIFGALFTVVPTLVLITSFSTYVMSGNELTGVKAFVTMYYITIIRIPLGIFPMVVSYIVQAMVSLKRIDKFLNNEELEEDNIENQPSDTEAIIVENGTFGWGSDEQTTLEDVNIKVTKGSLTAVSYHWFVKNNGKFCFS